MIIESKTIKFLNSFYEIVSNVPNHKDEEFIRNYELKIADSIIKDFGDETANKIAEIMLILTK